MSVNRNSRPTAASNALTTSFLAYIHPIREVLAHDAHRIMLADDRTSHCIAQAPSCAEDFYRGKTVRIIVGGSAGGGFDTYTRVMARHMGKHIPGNPPLMVENMTGAGTLIAAKYLAQQRQARRLSHSAFSTAGLILGRRARHEGHRLRHARAGILGVPVQDSTVCALRKESGVSNVDQWFASKSPLKLGGLSPGNSTSDVARIINAALNLPIQVVEGYKGTAEVRMAADAGELHGACWAWESMRVEWAKRSLQSGEVNVVLQVTAKKSPTCPMCHRRSTWPRPTKRAMLLKAGAIDPAAIVRVYVTSPRTPKDRLQILRRRLCQDT